VRSALESELLNQVLPASPAFFERLVVELMVRMGDGGSVRDAGQAITPAGRPYPQSSVRVISGIGT
jgi:restriction system protein